MIPKLFHYFTSTFFRTSKIPWCLHVPQGWTHPSPSPWWRRVISAFLVMFNPFSRHFVKETWVNDWRIQQMFINGCLKHTTDVFVDVLCLKGIPKVYHSGRRRFGGEYCTEAMMLSTRRRCRMSVDCCRTILEKRNPPPGYGDFCLNPEMFVWQSISPKRMLPLNMRIFTATSDTCATKRARALFQCTQLIKYT